MKHRFNALPLANNPLELDVTRQRLKQTLSWLAATAALLGVFALYTQADFLLVLSNQLWACF